MGNNLRPRSNLATIVFPAFIVRYRLPAAELPVDLLLACHPAEIIDGSSADEALYLIQQCSTGDSGMWSERCGQMAGAGGGCLQNIFTGRGVLMGIKVLFSMGGQKGHFWLL
jgi:hypothetical protein